MNLQDIYYLSQVGAAIALVGSLIFVGVQVRQASNEAKRSSQATRAASAYDANKTWALANIDIAKDPELAALVSKMFDDKNEVGDFSESELARVHFLIRAMLQIWSSHYLLVKEGILPQSYWDDWSGFATRFRKIPVVTPIVALERDQGSVSQEFFEALFGAVEAGDPDLAIAGSREDHRTIAEAQSEATDGAEPKANGQ